MYIVVYEFIHTDRCHMSEGNILIQIIFYSYSSSAVFVITWEPVPVHRRCQDSVITRLPSFVLCNIKRKFRSNYCCMYKVVYEFIHTDICRRTKYNNSIIFFTVIRDLRYLSLRGSLF